MPPFSLLTSNLLLLLTLSFKSLLQKFRLQSTICLNLLIFLSMTLQLSFRIYWVLAAVFNRFYCSHKYTQLLLTGDNNLVSVNRWFSASTYMKLVAVCKTCFHGQKAMTSPDESWHFYRRLFSPLCLHTVPIEAFHRAPSPSIRRSSLCGSRGAEGPLSWCKNSTTASPVIFHNWPHVAGTLHRFPPALLNWSHRSDKDGRAIVWKCDWWFRCMLCLENEICCW